MFQGDFVGLLPETFVKLARGSQALLTFAHGSASSPLFLPQVHHVSLAIITMFQNNSAACWSNTNQYAIRNLKIELLAYLQKLL